MTKRYVQWVIIILASFAVVYFSMGMFEQYRIGFLSFAIQTIAGLALMHHAVDKVNTIIEEDF